MGNGKNFALFLSCASIGIGFVPKSNSDVDEKYGVDYDTEQTVNNWSGTHSFSPSKIYEPKTTLDALRLLLDHNKRNSTIRPIGMALSPNGIGMSKNGNSAISLTNFDHVKVNEENMEVTVGGGARVKQILKELKKHSLTLENFSAIQEQAIAGWTQVAAHGTGITLPTVEEQVTEMTIVTPAYGIMKISKDNYPHLFSMCKVGLGSLGLVTELKLKCMKSIRLHETAKSYERAEISKGHVERLKQNRHVRYLWFPYSSHMLSILSNPILESQDQSTESEQNAKTKISSSPSTSTFTAMHGLAIQSPTLSSKYDTNEILKMTVPQLRDLLLDMDPLNLEVNP